MSKPFRNDPSVVVTGTSRWALAGWIVVARALGMMATVALIVGRDTGPPTAIVKFDHDPPEGVGFGFMGYGNLAVAPDGGGFVFGTRS